MCSYKYDVVAQKSLKDFHSSWGAYYDYALYSCNGIHRRSACTLYMHGSHMRLDSWFLIYGKEIFTSRFSRYGSSSGMLLNLLFLIESCLNPSHRVSTSGKLEKLFPVNRTGISIIPSNANYPSIKYIIQLLTKIHHRNLIRYRLAYNGFEPKLMLRWLIFFNTTMVHVREWLVALWSTHTRYKHVRGSITAVNPFCEYYS